MIHTLNSDQERHVGRLTGFRCPECGTRMWVTLESVAWCGRQLSGCKHKEAEQIDLRILTHVQIPNKMIGRDEKLRMNKDFLQGYNQSGK